ncbi:MAG: hypothetical protein FWF22_04505, partial [Treponema sp.]|nr:hypothetical protein [Treponema sp.]
MKTIFTLFLLIVFAGLMPAVEITVPRFELVTLGRTVNDEFSLASSVSADLALSGGYKYGLYLGFSFDSDNLAKALMYKNLRFNYASGDPMDPVQVGDYNDLVSQANGRLNSQGTLTFRTVKAVVRDLFNLPLELGYFVGEGDNFCSGYDFDYRFGDSSIGTDYRGLFYFPDGIGGNINRRYDGIYTATGTGFSLALTKWDFIVPMVYVYQNFSPQMLMTGTDGDTLYSGDLRVLLNLENFQLEVFGGLS